MRGETIAFPLAGFLSSYRNSIDIETNFISLQQPRWRICGIELAVNIRSLSGIFAPTSTTCKTCTSFASSTTGKRRRRLSGPLVFSFGSSFCILARENSLEMNQASVSIAPTSSDLRHFAPNRQIGTAKYFSRKERILTKKIGVDACIT